MKILIIEDEKPAADRLTRLIHEIEPSAEIVGIVDSVEEELLLLELLLSSKEVRVLLSSGLITESFVHEVRTRARPKAQKRDFLMMDRLDFSFKNVWYNPYAV